ncbi:MAG: phosphatidylserine decarboxylase [Candidatus Methanoperedens sp.]|jgi:phosphatidylserine decarboxylase|nr:phosphatidylserine decarboxylase [Candidatus Methanoperedens sp.]PKL54512.1 MAG: phosphatidylserine decarboxylase family protein [Candidatus Methanoperedenaceae archaeon HGW-Methanoperedenaceae-1]
MLAKGSLTWIFGVFLFTLVTGYISQFWSGSTLAHFLFIIGILLTLFFIVFFRDPERTPQGDDDDMVSPADGKVIRINDRIVCIFMNIHNVHVNRAPLSGIVTHIDYKPGGFIPAFNKDSNVNERNHVVVKSDYGILELTQIAGILTRRIVSYISEGGHVERGERIGMIRFGSRVDVVIPEGYGFIIRKGANVKAGETIIAMKKEKIQ